MLELLFVGTLRWVSAPAPTQPAPLDFPTLASLPNQQQWTIHHEPWNTHPKLFTPNYSPWTIHHEPPTPNYSPQTIHHEPFTM